jgi:hypothetical protein
VAIFRAPNETRGLSALLRSNMAWRHREIAEAGQLLRLNFNSGTEAQITVAEPATDRLTTSLR